MVNPVHVKILEQGVEVLSKWQEENPEIVLYLRGGELNKINLTSADLTQADLTRANLFNAKLNEANIENSIIQDTLFSDLDLSETKGLDKLRPLGPSSIDHRTFMKSKNLPEKFLQDCGLPEQFIEHLSGLLN